MIDLPPPPPAVEQPAPNDAGTIVTALGVAMTRPTRRVRPQPRHADQGQCRLAPESAQQGRGPDLCLSIRKRSGLHRRARDGSAYTQQLLASVAVDTGKAFGLRGGKFIFTVIHRKGVDLTATRLGNLFEVQELYGGGQDFRPANITYEQEFNHGRTAVKIGIYNSGADFATLPSGCNFQNFAFCPRPTTLFYNSGFSGFPVPRWGLRVKQQIGGGWAISTAIFEVNSLRAQSFHGWDLAPRFDSAVIPVELQWKGGQRPGQLPR
jgi:porin